MEMKFRLTKPINIEAFDREMRSSMGENYYGLRVEGEELYLVFDGLIPSAVEAAFNRSFNSHDAAQLTDSQRAAIELEALRTNNKTPLDAESVTIDANSIRKLASKVAWLEQEVIRMVGSEGGRI